MSSFLCVVFCLSGAAALIFEMLWFWLAGLAFGNSVWAASIVLSSFMGGLALGNAFIASRGDRIERPIRFYAMLEIIIGVSGLFLVFIFPHLTGILRPLFAPFLDQPFLLNAMRTSFAFVLMLIPTAAMGATLPLLAKAINQQKHNFGSVLGFLYGSNTLGAVMGVVLAEVFLIKRCGLNGTGMIGMSLNMVAAILAFGISRKLDGSRPPHPDPLLQEGEGELIRLRRKFSPRTKGLLVAGFFSGFALLALEVVWFRFLVLFFNASPLNLAIILATVLSAISLGGFLASLWFKRRETFPLGWLFCISALLVVLSYWQFQKFYTWHFIYEQGSDARRLIFASLFMVFPLSLISGVAFTVIGRQLHNELGRETRTAGMLTLVNTLGGMCGSVLAGFVFIPFLGMERTFLLLSLLYALLLVGVIGGGNEKSRRAWFWRLASAPLAVIILIVFPYHAMERYLDLPVAIFRGARGEVRVAVREGSNETIQYTAKFFINKPRYLRLVTNGHSMSSTMPASKRYMQTFVYLPVALHPQPRNAALICFGCGMTAKALTETKSLEAIDIVDISKEVVAMSTNIFPESASNPIHDKRVRLHIEDGRFFLATTREKYDIITGEPPPPTFRGVVNLYTQEYFQLIRDRLADGGIVTYWLPVDLVAPDNAKAILKAFCNVFPNATLWSASGDNWMMVGIKDVAARVSEADFAAQWRESGLTNELHALGLEKPEHLGAMFIADGRRLDEWIGPGQAATDDFPARVYDGFDVANRRETLAYFHQFLDRSAMAENFKSSPEIAKLWPGELARRTEAYFANAQTMILDYPMTALDSMKTLRKHLTDPVSTDYDLYALLDSDEYVQRILTAALADIQQTPKTMLGLFPETFRRLAQSGDRQQFMAMREMGQQLAVRAIAERDYLLAEKYYAMLSDISDRDSKKDFASMRALLLYSSNEIQQAAAVLQNIRPTLTGKEATELDNYTEWLRTAFTR